MKSDGPDGGHHFLNFHKHCQARDCLGDHFGKNEAREKTLSGICGQVTGTIIFLTFANMVWEGIVFGTIFKNN